MKAKLDKKAALISLKEFTDRAAKEGKSKGDSDYARLQYSWNKDILERSFDYIPTSANKLMGIGTFQGALEMSMAKFFDQVVCVDHKSYLPSWKPKNIKFHKANIDTGDWKLPDEMYDICYLVETIEHLLWSPLPLLTWMKKHSHISVISTPDDAEWPEMPVQPWNRYQKYDQIPTAFPGAKGNPLPMFHCKQYTQAELIAMLDHVGFRVLEFFRTGEGKHQMVAIVQPKS